jgi:hypothetical protein
MFRDRLVLAATALCLCAFVAAFASFRAAASPPPQQRAAAATCQHAEVVMIALRGEGSRATLRAGDGTTWSQREGQSMRGHRLEAIELDRVVLSHEGSPCELRVAAVDARALAMR